MNCAAKFDELLATGPISTEQALAFFDELEPVNIAFMLGSWRGKGFPTHHRMDGLMENFNWYGKLFESSEEVHPLVFKRRNGELVRLNPIWFPMQYAGRSRLSMSALGRLMFDLGTRFFKTPLSLSARTANSSSRRPACSASPKASGRREPTQWSRTSRSTCFRR